VEKNRRGKKRGVKEECAGRNEEQNGEGKRQRQGAEEVRERRER